MAKLTFNFELSRNVTKSGVSHVLLRIQDDHQSKKRINTGIDVIPTNWNVKRQRVRTSDADYAVKNAKLQEILDNAESAKGQLLSADVKVDANSVSLVYKKEQAPLSFLQFFRDYTKRLYETGDQREYVKYKTALMKLQFFLNKISYEAYLAAPSQESDEFPEFAEKAFKKDLEFSEVTNGFINEYIAYLKCMPNHVCPNKVLAMGTVKKQIAIFQACYNKGVKERNYQYRTNPFYDIKLSSSPGTKAKLTLEEIDKLNDVPLSSGDMLLVARDCFMFAFYCAGMRCGDVLELRGINLYQQDNSWRLNYTMGKTGKHKDIKLQWEALAILTRYVDYNHLNSDYIFPLLRNQAPYAHAKTSEEIKLLPPVYKRKRVDDLESNNAKLNKYLKILAKMAGVEKHVSMHVARHSFADNARVKGANMYDIMHAMGHSKLVTTQTYLAQLDTDSQDATLDMVYRRKTSAEKLVEQLNSLSLVELNQVLAESGYKLVPLK